LIFTKQWLAKVFAIAPARAFLDKLYLSPEEVVPVFACKY
jgi:hypothetical protein